MLRVDFINLPNHFYPVGHSSAWILFPILKILLLHSFVIHLLSLLSFVQCGHSSLTSANSHAWLGAFIHSEIVAHHWTPSPSIVLLQRVKFALGLWSRLQSVYQLLKSNCLTCILLLHLDELFCCLKIKWSDSACPWSFHFMQIPYFLISLSATPLPFKFR